MTNNYTVKANSVQSTMRRRNLKCLICVCFLVYLFYFLGVSDYVFSKNFKNGFEYPLNIDIRPVVEEIMVGNKPSVNPINFYPYRFLTNSGVCLTHNKIDLFIVVKSAVDRFGYRMAIRQTYGRKNFVQGRTVKMLFFLGVDGKAKSETQKKIDKEMSQHKDIIQIDFHDSYYNNTIKTMMEFRWSYQHCSEADFYLFTDDDMYISVANLLKYIDKEFPVLTNKSQDTIPNGKEREKEIFAGYVFDSAPLRLKSSKWRVSLNEYPWNKWPPYVTAGAYIVSNRAMKMLYLGSLFVKHFRFDDIYLAIVAKKLGIVPIHCPKFHYYKKEYDKASYKDVIASHGYDDHDELIRVWEEQNT